jgi:hypothetical protein
LQIPNPNKETYTQGCPISYQGYTTEVTVVNKLNHSLSRFFFGSAAACQVKNGVCTGFFARERQNNQNHDFLLLPRLLRSYRRWRGLAQPAIASLTLVCALRGFVLLGAPWLATLSGAAAGRKSPVRHAAGSRQ